MKINNDLWADAKCLALRVEFLSTREELFMYSSAIYYAVMWGKGIDNKNKIIKKMDMSIK